LNVNGSLGIGTALPTTKFHVYNGDGRLDRGANTSGVGRVLTINGARSGSGFSFAQLNFENFDSNNGAVDYIGASISSQNAGSADGGDLRFFTKDGASTLTEKMIISKEGNIGVGSTSPTDKLHLIGNFRVDAGKIDFRNTGNSVFIGQEAGLNDDLSANNNTYVGFEAGKTGTNANNNTALGYKALALNTSTENTAIGSNALANSAGAFQNVAIGNNAMVQSTGGNYNVVVGSNAFITNTVGDGNVIIGQEAGKLSTGNGNVFIGRTAGFNETSNEKLYIDNSSTSTPLIWGDFAANYVNINGNLGVGTDAPLEAKLVVNGSQNNNLGTHGFLNNVGGTGINSGNSGYSIYASHRIAASQFNAFSDARIKKITGRTNNANDLATLANIKITNYKHIDSISKGDAEIKKVIAQELKAVYPQAVSTMTDVVPDIYQQASIENGFIALPTNLKVGEKVKIIFADSENILEVTEAGKTGFKVNSDKVGKIFVYGRQVDDFHVVDYEALSTLNISATQELLKRIESLECENKKIKELEAKIQNIENMLQNALPTK
jgi:hypothetical protein